MKNTLEFKEITLPMIGAFMGLLVIESTDTKENPEGEIIEHIDSNNLSPVRQDRILFEQDEEIDGVQSFIIIKPNMDPETVLIFYSKKTEERIESYSYVGKTSSILVELSERNDIAFVLSELMNAAERKPTFDIDFDFTEYELPKLGKIRAFLAMENTLVNGKEARISYTDGKRTPRSDSNSYLYLFEYDKTEIKIRQMEAPGLVFVFHSQDLEDGVHAWGYIAKRDSITVPLEPKPDIQNILKQIFGASNEN